MWDDDEYVTDNPSLHDARGLARIWLEPRASPQYYPLVFTTFWLEQRLGGAPALSHAVNVLLHLANAFLLWFILGRLGIGAAYAIALLFAVHPVHVESVAWITERKNVLSGFFYLLSFSAYVRAASSGRDGALFDRSPSLGWYATALALFGAALLSKTVTASLPVIILLVIWWARGRLRRQDVAPLAPFVLLGGVAGLMTAWLEVVHVGAAGADWSLSMAERVLVAGRALWFYAWKVCWPHPLIFIYPRWTLDVSSLFQWIFPLAAIGAGVALRAGRARWGNGPFAVWLGFVVTLFPVLGFLDVYPMRYAFVADHFQYLASVATIGAATVGAARLLRHAGRRAPALVLAIATVVCVGITRAETARFQDAGTLWRDTIRKHPGSWMAHNNLGILQLSQGQLAPARSSFERAVSARPDFAVGHNNLGTALFRTGRPDLAAASHRRAIDIDPRYAEAHNNLAVALSAMGRQDEAIANLQHVLVLDPDYPTAHYNLANAMARQRRYAEAEPHYLAALRRVPDMAMAHYYLGLSRMELGRVDEAVASFDAAFRLKPSFEEGYLEAGNALLRAGRPELAETYRRRGASAPGTISR